MATTALATVVVAVALAVGATTLIVALRHTLIADVEEGARSQALEVAHRLGSGPPPDLSVAGSDDQLIQVLTPAGAVLASTPNVAGESAVATLVSGQAARVVTPLDTDEFMVVAQGAQTSEGPRTVLVGRPLVDVLDVTDVVSQLLIVGLVVLLAVVAGITWTTVGRA